jgi:excinuclease ABC subunit C
MQLPDPEIIELAPESGNLDEAAVATPAVPAVFLVWAREGAPYLGRTASLRRRLSRLLRAPAAPSRMLNLREVARRIEYWVTASRLESAIYSYALARRHFPETYRTVLKLRMPHYVKLILTNPFPRTQVTARLASSRSLYYGPFPSRASAERFENEFLDLFQLRRCQEDLAPSPEHPGCIYGEMNRCLRPCQRVVGLEEYRSEAERVAEFLTTKGASLLRSVAAARDRLSEELDFEEAARQHARFERVHQVVRSSDDLAGDIDRLNGVAVTASAAPEEVVLWFLLKGCWQMPLRFRLSVEEGKPAPLDRRLREAMAALNPARLPALERQEHLALLARWYYSSWRDGEWLSFDHLDSPPLRKLVNAIHRVATRAEAHAPSRPVLSEGLG